MARSSTAEKAHYRVVIIGGGDAGVSVAARLNRRGVHDVAIVEPSAEHYYQPLWTLVGGGLVDARKTVRRETSVLPRQSAWIRDRATGVDPENRVVQLHGGTVGYDRLVVAPGIQLDWDATPGMPEAMATPFASSNYSFRLAPKTWEVMRDLTRGTAVFTMPGGAIKCPGAPQKIAYLCADHWRQRGVLGDIRVVLVLPGGGLFGVPVFANELAKAVERYGIEVHFNTDVVEIDAASRRVELLDNTTGAKEPLDYDVLHAAPRQSAPDWVKHSPLADPNNVGGYVEVDKHTLQHVRFPEIFALGDVANSPNSKTGAAIRKQAPVVAANLISSLADDPQSAIYDGYAACPFTTARNRMLLAEFDYACNHRPSIPLIDATRPRYDMWLLKRYGLPLLYWHVLMRGLG